MLLAVFSIVPLAASAALAQTDETTPPDTTTTTAPDTTAPDPTTTTAAPDTTAPDPTTTTSAADTTTTAPTGESSSLIVKTIAGLTTEQQDAAIARNGGTQTSSIPALRLHVVSVPSADLDAAIASFQNDTDIVSVSVDTERAAETAATDPSYPDQWSLPQIGWDQVHGEAIAPTGTANLAVLDTGVDPSAPDLTDVGGGWSAFGDTGGNNDPNGHGTHMATIAAAAADDGTGIAGVASTGVHVMPIQVLGADGTGTDSDIITGLVWAVDHGADVALMAFSNPGQSAALQDAINYAWSHGVVVVAAAGNDGSTDPTYPAGDAKVVGVGATDQTDALWSGSNQSQGVFLGAPGVDVLASDASGTTAVTGTSASAAEVAGAAALLREADASASNGTIVGRLARNADPLNGSTLGNGRIDVARAIADTDATEVVPEGAPGGGPVVGPYVAAAIGLNSVTVGAQSPVSVVQGNSATFNVDVNANGSGGSLFVKLTVSTAVANTSNSFTSSCLTFSSSGTTPVTLTTSTTGTTPLGTTAFTVQGQEYTTNACTTAVSPAKTKTGGGSLYVTGAPNKLLFTAQPGNTTAGSSFSTQAKVAVTDTSGNVITADNSTKVTLAIANNPASGTLGNCTNTQVTVVAGVATFANCNIDKAGTGYTLAATDTTGGGAPHPYNAAANATSFNITAGAATKLVFTSTLVNSTGGTAFGTQPVVVVQDALGNTVTTDNSTQVSLAIKSGTGAAGAAVTCTTNPLTVTAGVASFANCKINLAGTAYQLRATDASSAGTHPYTLADSNAFDVNTGAAAQISLSGGTTNLAAGTQRGLTATIQDAGGNTVNSSASVTFSKTTGAGSVDGLGSANATAGIALLNVTGHTAGSVTLQASIAGPINSNTLSFTVVVGTATHLAFLQAPTTATAGANISPAVTVQVFDYGNNLVAGGSVDMTIANNAGPGGTLSGTSPRTATGGTATFSNLSIDKTGTGYTLLATLVGTGITVESSPFDITPGAADHLTFSQQPTNTQAGQTIASVKVRVEDKLDNLVTGSAASVSLTISANPCGGTPALNGTIPQTAAGGVATFSDLNITKACDGYKLQATSASLKNDTSSAFNITPGPATHLAFGTQPSDTVAGSSISPPVTVELRDQYDNVATSSSGSVSLAIHTAPCGGSPILGGTLPQSTTAGVATFSDLSITKACDGYVLRATSGVLALADSNTFNITPAAADHLGFDQQPTDTIAGQAITPAVTVDVFDQYGNLVTGSSASIDMAIGTDCSSGATLGGTTTQTASAGVATFDDLSIDKGCNGYTLQATSTGLTAADSDPFDIIGADVSVVKTGPTDVNAGEDITYTLTVHNAGPSQATNVSVKDNLPTDVATGAKSCIVDAGASVDCLSYPTDYSDYTDNTGISLGTLAVDDTVVVMIHVSVPSSEAADTVLTDKATVSTDTFDLDTSNNTDSLDTTVHTEADLSTSKSGPSETVAGASAGFDYTITVTNNGPSDNTGGFTVSDTLPAGTTFVPSPGGSDAACSATGQDVTCTSSAGLVDGGTKSFTVHVTVGHAVAEGSTLSNTASVSSDGTDDPNDTNDTSSPATETTVHANADMSITKSDAVTQVTAGTSTDYTITATNNGPSDAQDVYVTDTIPSGVSNPEVCVVTNLVDCTLDAQFSSYTSGDHITIGVVAAGDSVDVHVRYDVNSSYANNTSLANTADVFSSTTDPVTGNEEATDTDTVITKADVSVDKAASAPSVYVNDKVTYTITVTNNGPSDAQSVSLADTLPAGLSSATYCTGSLCDPSTGSSWATPLAIGTLTSGQASVVKIQATVGPPGGVTITNTATGSTTTTDPTPGNNSDSVDVSVNKRLTSLAYTGDTSAQYSDTASFSATLKDVTGGAPGVGINGKTINFKLVCTPSPANDVSASASTNASGVATVTSAQLLRQPGTCTPVSATFTADSTYAGATDSKTFTLTKEDATVGLTSPLFFSTGSESATTTNVALTAQVTQAADGSLGDITKAKVCFDLYNSNNLLMVTPDLTHCGVVPNSSGVASYTFPSVGIDSWTVIARLDPTNCFFTGPASDPVVITVYAPVADKYVTGGGWIVDPGTGNKPVAISPTNNHGNFGFNVKYKKGSTTDPQGQAVFVFRGADGYDYVVKSNAWQSGQLAFPTSITSGFSGKANVTVINPATGQAVTGLGGGNFTFRVDVTDNGSPGSTDKFAITVYTGGGAIYHQAGVPASQITLGGGNVVVHSTTSK